MPYYHVHLTKNGIKGTYRLEVRGRVLRIGVGERKLTDGRIQILSIDNCELYTANLDKSETIKTANILKRLFSQQRIHNYTIKNPNGDKIGALWALKSRRQESYVMEFENNSFRILTDADEFFPLTVYCNNEKIASMEKGLLFDGGIFYSIAADICDYLDPLFLFSVYYDIIHTSLNTYIAETSLLPQQEPKPVEMMTKSAEIKND